MHFPQGHVAQVDQVGLVLGGHAKQLDAVEELTQKDTERERLGLVSDVCCAGGGAGPFKHNKWGKTTFCYYEHSTRVSESHNFK